MKSKREREEACDLCGHYHDYEGGEPCSVCGHRLQHSGEAPAAAPAIVPAPILQGFLYLGSYDVASRSELLKAMSITHILNTVPSSINLFKNSFVYHAVEGVPPDFEECNKFLDSVRQAGAKVLVHCMSGYSRSPSVVIAYLMHARSWNLAAAFSWTRDAHPATAITPTDEKRLKEYELRVLNASSVGFGGLPMVTGGAESPHAPHQQQQSQPMFSWNSSTDRSAGLASQQQQQFQQPGQQAGIFTFGGSAASTGDSFVFGRQ